MKITKYLSLLTVVLLGVIVMVTSCEEESNYNFNNVEPGKTEITGPELVYTGPEYEFIALPRGGSSYAWAKVSGDFTFTSEGYVATVVSDAAVNGTGVLMCTETTAGGKTGEADTITFSIAKFCTLDINDFVGPYTCDEAGYGPYLVNLSLDPNDPLTLINDNFWDWAAAGQVIRYELSGDFDQIVTVPLQDFIFGDESAGTVEGSGTYEGCTGVMTVDYNVVYDGGDNPTSHVFTPGAPTVKSGTILKKGN